MKKYNVLGTVSLKGISIIASNSIKEAEGGNLLASLGEPNICSKNSEAFEIKIKESFVNYYCSEEKEQLPFTAVIAEQQLELLKKPDPDAPLENVLNLFMEYPENKLKFIKTPFSMKILNDIQTKLSALNN